MALLAQSDEGAAAAFVLIVGLGILGLQIYLIYAIIATRQDARWLRKWAEWRGGSGGSESDALEKRIEEQKARVAAKADFAQGTPGLGARARVPGPHQYLWVSEEWRYVCQAPGCGYRAQTHQEFEEHQRAVLAAAPSPQPANVTDKLEPSGEPSVPEQLKTCPDCAEEVRAAARVCRFCGYRFD